MGYDCAMTSPVYYITGIENTPWTDEWNTSINPVQATAYGHLLTPNGLVLQMISKVPYGGWLCKNVQQWPSSFQQAHITLGYELLIDDATLISAQVIETDTRATAADGSTFCADFQFNIAKGWMIQYGSPWQDSGVKITPPQPGVVTGVQINYLFDFPNHVVTLLSVNMGSSIYSINKMMPAKHLGWAANEIVTQLQQCNTGVPGGYTLRFSQIQYSISA
jgi:hypothetical protein